jgi:hypothetical protein
MKVSGETAKITKTVIEGAWRRRVEGCRLIVRDKETSGLALIVNSTAMAWSYSYRPRGTDPVTKKRWPNRALTLGSPGSMSVDDARHAAASLRGQVAAGGDPHAERKANAARAAAERAETVSRLLDDYEKALPQRPKLRGAGRPTPKHVAEELAQARAAAQAMDICKLSVVAITPAHLRRLLEIEVSRPATARRRFGTFVRFCDWLVDERKLVANPCTAISKAWRPKPPPSRSRCPSPANLARLWHAADKLAPPSGTSRGFSCVYLVAEARPKRWNGSTPIYPVPCGRSPIK